MFAAFKNILRVSLAALLFAPVFTIAPAPAEAQTRCGAAVTVSPGDTLARIARRCGTSVGALVNANPQIRNPNVIHVGMTVRMPGAAGSPQPPSAPGRAAPGEYQVRPGDTLAAIAQRLGIPLSVLLQVNRDIDPRRLEPGFVIRLPGDDEDGQRPPEQPERITATGTLTREGVECPALRGDNGQLYTLAGETGRFGPGDRVQVRGTRAEASFCQQGTTIDVADIRSAGGGDDGDDQLTVTGTITREGVECPVLRGDDGELYTLAGDTGRFGPGDRVQVQGQRAEASICQQGTTIDVARMRQAP